MKAKLLVTIACGIALFCGSAAAQPPMGGGGFPGGGMPPMGGGGFRGMPGMGYNGGVVDMTAVANVMAQDMGRELGLNEQQIKKIAKLNKKELDRRMNHMHSVGVPRMNFEPGMGPGMGGPGMGPGMRPGGMRPGGGFPGMPEAEQQEQEMPQWEVNPNEPPEVQEGRAAISRLEALEETEADVKARIKIEKKMKKILTEEQYARWSVLRDGRHNFQLRPEAEFDLDNIPEELREQFLERIRRGRYRELPGNGQTPPGPPTPPTPPAPQQ